MPEPVVVSEHFGSQVGWLPIFLILDHVRHVSGCGSGTIQFKAGPKWLVAKFWLGLVRP
jgi:hypothetical protein